MADRVHQKPATTKPIITFHHTVRLGSVALKCLGALLSRLSGNFGSRKFLKFPYVLSPEQCK